MSAQFRVVHLHGAAAVQFGSEFKFACDTPRDAIRALVRFKPGFRKFVEQADWRIVRGPLGKGIDSDLDMLALRFGRCEELHLIPLASGAGRGKGVGKIILGVALAATAVAASFVPGGQVYSAGVAVGTSGGGLAFGTSIGFAGITTANVALFGAALAIPGTSQLVVSKP